MQHHKLGLYIKLRRKQLGKSLNKFAFDVEIEPATLSRTENLKQDIFYTTLVKIADGFGQTPAEFLTDFEKNK